jgi:hypothetical protein
MLDSFKRFGRSFGDGNENRAIEEIQEETK